MQSCQIEENWEKHKHFCTLLPAMQGLKAVLILDPDFCISQACPHANRHKVTDCLGSAAGCTAAIAGPVTAGKPPGLEGLRFRHS